MKKLSTKKLSTLRLVGITFCMVSGSAYGLEEVISKTSYGFAILSLILIPILWSLMIGLMVAELSAMIPKEGGFYEWTKRALGPFWGFQQTWLALAASMLDMAIYPTLFATYAGYLIPHLKTGPWPLVLAGGAILVGVIINIRGIQAVGLSSAWAMLLLIAPFLTLIGLVIINGPVVAAQHVLVHPSPSVLFAGVMISMWNCMGWDNVSTIANEVERPQRTYPLALIGSVALVTAVYVAPVAAMAASGIPHTAWSTGYWVTAAQLYGGEPLRIAMAIGGMLCGMGMFSPLVSSYSRLPVALAKDGWLPKIFAYHHPVSGAPIPAILACSVFWALSLGIGFERLVTLDVMLYGGSLMLEFAALIALRIKEPCTHRPFKVPGGLAGVVAISVPPCALIIGALIHNRDERIMGMSGLMFGALVAVLGVVVYFLRRKHYRAVSG